MTASDMAFASWAQVRRLCQRARVELIRLRRSAFGPLLLQLPEPLLAVAAASHGGGGEIGAAGASGSGGAGASGLLAVGQARDLRSDEIAACYSQVPGPLPHPGLPLLCLFCALGVLFAANLIHGWRCCVLGVLFAGGQPGL